MAPGPGRSSFARPAGTVACHPAPPFEMPDAEGPPSSCSGGAPPRPQARSPIMQSRDPVTLCASPSNQSTPLTEIGHISPPPSPPPSSPPLPSPPREASPPQLRSEGPPQLRPNSTGKPESSERQDLLSMAEPSRSVDEPSVREAVPSMSEPSSSEPSREVSDASRPREASSPSPAKSAGVARSAG